MIDELISQWVNQNKCFFVSESDNISYDQLKRDFNQLTLPKPKANEILCLLALNHYQTYLYFLKALEQKIPVFLIPEFLYQSEKLLKDQIPFIRKENIFKAENKEIFFQETNYPFLDESYFLIRTSGSTGIPKIIIHQTKNFIKKYQNRNKSFEKTMAFSPLDSIAGVETLLECVTLGKTLISRNDTMAPDRIVECLINNKVDYFQTTPSFLNLLIISKQIEKLNHSSLKKIDYGSEPTGEKILEKIVSILPTIQFIQTYGLSEVGILPTINHPHDLLYFKLDKNFTEYKIVENILFIKTNTLLVDYLNQKLNLEENFLNTNDIAVIKDDYFTIKGRNSDIINIGGRKFFPIELENLLSSHPDILNCTAMGLKNDIMGEMIKVKIELKENVDEMNFRGNFLEFCDQNIPSFMRPHILEFNYSKDDFKLKKMRK